MYQPYQRPKYCKGMKMERLRRVFKMILQPKITLYSIILKTTLRSYSDFSGIKIARNTTECEHLEIPKYPSTIAGFLNEKRFHIPFDDVTDLINIEQSCTVKDSKTTLHTLFLPVETVRYGFANP